MQEIERILREALENGEVLGIIYHGGTQPGAFRDITPIKIDGDKVRARCYSSNAVKTFKLEKIELRGATPTSEEKAAEWSPVYANADRFGDPATILTTYSGYLRALGWHVGTETDEEFGATNITLRGFFKNGKVRRAPEVSLAYSPFIEDVFVSESSNELEFERRESTKPWVLRSKHISTTRTFKKSDSAVDAFLKLAEERAPNRTTSFQRPLLPKSTPVPRREVKRSAKAYEAVVEVRVELPGLDECVQEEPPIIKPQLVEEAAEGTRKRGLLSRLMLGLFGNR